MEDKMHMEGEIERRKELLEYEVPEVVLKLRGEVSSMDSYNTTIEDLGLTREDFFKTVEFTPISELDIDQNAPHFPDMPRQPEFVPIEMIDIAFPKKELPNADVRLEYTPVVSAVADIYSIAVPATVLVSEFVPLQTPKKAKSTAKIPKTVTVPEFEPPVEITPPALDIICPVMGKSPHFKPLGEIEPPTLNVVYPVLKDAPEILPPAAVKLDASKQHIPDVNTKITFAPLQYHANIKSKLNLPVTTSNISYEPVVSEKPPVSSGSLLYKKPIAEFSPIEMSGVDNERYAHAVSALKLYFAYSYEGIKGSLAEKSFGIELADDMTAPKDFYAIWESM